MSKTTIKVVLRRGISSNPKLQALKKRRTMDTLKMDTSLLFCFVVAFSPFFSCVVVVDVVLFRFNFSLMGL